MNNTGPSPLEIVLWIVLANVVLVALAYGVYQWLRKKAIDDLLLIEEHLRHYDDRVRGILDFLQKYGNINVEPFLAPINQLTQDTQDIAVRLQELDEAGQALRSEIENTAANQMQKIINAPVKWFTRWRRSKEMLKVSSAIDTDLAAIEQQMQSIDNLPWQVATHVRTASQQVNEMSRLAQNLRQKGAQGESLRLAAARIPILQRSLSEVPAKFLESGQNELLASASYQETIKAFETVSTARPVIDHWLPYLREWDRSQRKASVEFNGIQQAVAALRQAIANPPAGLKAEPIADRLNQVTLMSSELEKRLNQPEVDQLKNMMREATRIRKLAEDAGQQFIRAGERAAELNQSLNELKSALESLSAQYKSMEEKESYPMVWDESGQDLKRIRQNLNSLVASGEARTPEQITADLERVAQIRSRHEALINKYQKVTDQYQSLVALLASMELKEGASWLLNAREMIAQAEIYDPHNWPKQEAVELLKSEVLSLSALQERVVPTGQAAPVQESRVSERLQDAQQLAELHKSLRPRVESTRARLEKIVALEKEGKAKLSSAWNALERASILAGSNELLSQSADADIKRETEELKRLGEELNARGQGIIEKKLQSIQGQYNTVIQNIQSWLARLDTENKALARQIGDQLAELDNIASLEDPPFQEARRLVSNPELRLRPNPTGQLRNPMAPKTLPSEQELSAEMKRKNDLWHSLLGSRQALEEKSTTLLEAYHEAVDARTQAQSRLGEVNTRQSQRRTWPPANQPPFPESQTLASVDAKWDAMRKQHVRVEWAILELGRLANQYRALSERAGQFLDRISQDQERIYELEEQIEDLKQRWSQQAQASPENAILYHGVQQLLSRADSQLAFIRQQYMRGTLSYLEVQQSLHLLSNEISTTRVPVDENRDIGLSNQRSRDQHARP
jgi:hypothetical protein